MEEEVQTQRLTDHAVHCGIPRNESASERRYCALDDEVDHAVEEPANLARSATGGGPSNDCKTNDRCDQQDERILGGGLAAITWRSVIDVVAHVCPLI